MKRLHVWIIGIMVILTGLLLWVGWDERHHAGYLPFIMGIVFGVFTLASIGAAAMDDGADEH